ncbi:MAG: hypothetical protein LCH41_01645 [Armatimonadetes bacterium]|nr:hypothetical protein [Armatimonadota bacterium]
MMLLRGFIAAGWFGMGGFNRIAQQPTEIPIRRWELFRSLPQSLLGP